MDNRRPRNWRGLVDLALWKGSAQADYLAVLIDIDMAIGRQTAQPRHGHDGARQRIDEPGTGAELHLVDGHLEIGRHPFEGWVVADGERRLSHADGQVIPSFGRELCQLLAALSESCTPRPP